MTRLEDDFDVGGMGKSRKRPGDWIRRRVGRDRPRRGKIRVVTETRFFSSKLEEKAFVRKNGKLKKRPENSLKTIKKKGGGRKRSGKLKLFSWKKES